MMDKSAASSTSNTAPPKAWYLRLGSVIAVYGAITVVTLVVVDLVLIALGLFPPQPAYGDAELGWVGAQATGEMSEQMCADYVAEVMVSTIRNEDGLRTSHSANEFRSNEDLFKIAVSGDSQTDLCAPNEETHFGVLERELTVANLPSATFSGGVGKYSPLQAYLAVKKFFPNYAPNAFVLNLYTGNDFYDMLRVDDRPHFVPDTIGYRIAPPIWYQETPPGTVRHSRVLFALHSLAQATGLRNTWIRVRYLRDTARSRGEGIGTVVRYMNDLRNSSSPDVGYSAAFAAQMLNQQLYFRRFPGSRDESVQRVRALLEMVRAENPDLLLILSPIPSYHLVPGDSVDRAFLDIFEKMPMTSEEGAEDERELYESLRQLADDYGWHFVDNLSILREYSGTERLYNSFDYHLTSTASEIIGREQAATILSQLRATVPASP